MAVNAWCDGEAERVARELGFSCTDASPVVTVRNPLQLENWTQPVLELVIIAGAVFALVHAVRRLRRDRDPINLALWIASLVYLFVIEPPLYFPRWFGIEEYVGFIFAHNVFTVQFMFDRLPLYIVAFYPAVSQLAYEIVRVTGIFHRRGPLLGAVSVAFACQVFYEVFDHLGPQLKWWTWNLDNEINQPMFASVPMNSMTLFASVSFAAMTYLVVRLIGTGGARGVPSLLIRTVVAGVLTPLVMTIASAPTAVLGGGAAVLWVELALLWGAGIWLLVDHWRAGLPTDAQRNTFVSVYPVAYLATMAVLWLSALPDYFAAVDGRTPAGSPIGSGPYALTCFIAATFLIVAGLRSKIIVSEPVLESARG